MSREDDDALCAAQNRHMEHPLRTDRITLIVKHRGQTLTFWRSRLAEVFDRCEAVYLAKGEDDEIERLRNGAAAGSPVAPFLKQIETIQAYNVLAFEQEAEIARLRTKETALLAAGDKLEQQLMTVAQQRDAMRLTDAEREAICEACDEGRWYPQDYHHIHTLRALLARFA